MTDEQENTETEDGPGLPSEKGLKEGKGTEFGSTPGITD